MKRFWDADELDEHFTLTTTDWNLIANKTEETRLGFAIMLKYLPYEGVFPTHASDVPVPITTHIAKQVGVAAEKFSQYSFRGRTYRDHRRQIREALDYRASTEQDLKELSAWLVTHLRPEDHYTEAAKQVALERLHTLRIEPPRPKQLRRVLTSASHIAEEEMAMRFSHLLTFSTHQALDDLLSTQSHHRTTDEDDMPHGTLEDDSDDQPELEPRRTSLLYELKRDPGRASIKSILREVDRLQMIRTLDL